MKKNYLSGFALVLFVLTTIGCKKNDNNTSLIQGKWFVKTQHFQVLVNNTTTTDTSYAVNGDVYFDFLKDGTLNEKDEDGNIYTYTYNYNDNNKKLIMQQDGFMYEYNVRELTATDLILYNESTETVEGTTATYTQETGLKR